MNKRNTGIKLFLFLIIAAVILTVIFCQKKSCNITGEKGNDKAFIAKDIEYAEPSDSKLPDSIATVSSPDIALQKEIPLENSEFKNLRDGFSFTVPDDYRVTNSENIYYVRNRECTIQIAVAVTSETHDSPASVFNDRSNFFNRMTAFFDGTEHRLINTGTSERKKKEIGPYTVSCECANAWFKNDSETKMYKTTAHTYYTVLENAGEIDGRGVIMTAFSEEDETIIMNTMDDILQSLSARTPSSDELDVSYEISTYSSPKADKAEIAYPSGWNLSENSDGMVIITSTDDVSSPYAGMIIEYIADDNNLIVDDYAQFCGNYEYDILLPYFLQPVGENAFNYRSVVTNTNLHASIGELESIQFDITDEIVPASRAIRYSMRRDQFLVNNIRYTFKSNGIDCMLNFIVPNQYCSELIQKLLEHSVFY